MDDLGVPLFQETTIYLEKPLINCLGTWAENPTCAQMLHALVLYVIHVTNIYSNRSKSVQSLELVITIVASQICCTVYYTFLRWTPCMFENKLGMYIPASPRVVNTWNKSLKQSWDTPLVIRNSVKNIWWFPEIGVPPNHPLEWFFQRASEQRVLLIVEVCHHIFSSHLHIFTSSHLHLLIFTTSHIHLLIFTSSHLHLLIFTS